MGGRLEYGDIPIGLVGPALAVEMQWILTESLPWPEWLHEGPAPMELCFGT